MRKKPDKRTIEEMILDSQPTMRIGAERNLRSAVQQTYRELGVSADNLSMAGITESPEQLETGEKHFATGARGGLGWRRFAGVAAALATIVVIFAVTVAVMGGRLGGNRGVVTPEKNPESNIPVYLLTEIGYPSDSEKEKVIYPKWGHTLGEVIMDWPGDYIVDSNCDYYDYKVMEEYRKTLAENGYTIIQGDPADIEEYRNRHLKVYDEGISAVMRYPIRETQGVYDGKQEWAAYKDGVLIVVEIPWSDARVYTYVVRETPTGGCTPEEAWNILMNSKTRVDLFPAAAGDSKESCTPNVNILPIDVTPSGMFEQTQAQVFLTLLMRDGILYRRFFILRDGIAYEWMAGNVAFADINGDGETEICMIQRNARADESVSRKWGEETFYVFERPKEDSVPQVKTMTLDSTAFPEMKSEPSGGGYRGINYCSLDCRGTTVVVNGRDERKYSLYLTDSLYLSDCETGKRVKQSGK